MSKINLEDLRREHGHRFLDHLLNRKGDNGKPMVRGSVKKEITMVRAMANKGVQELDLKNASNPLEKFELPKEQTVFS